MGHFRLLRLRVFYYLDDWLLVTESKELLELLLYTTLLWTQFLGFLVFWEEVFPGSAPALLWQKFLGLFCQFCGLSPLLQDAVETSSASLPSVLLSLDRFSGHSVPLSPEIKALCRAWASPSRLLEGILFAPPPHCLVVSTDASHQGWGRFFIFTEGCG